MSDMILEEEKSERLEAEVERLEGQLSRTEATLSVAKAIIARQSLEIEQLKSIVLSRDTDDSIDRLYEGTEDDEDDN